MLDFKMLSILTTVCLILNVMIAIWNPTITYGQAGNVIDDKFTKRFTDPRTNTTAKLTPVHVNYESQSTILISGDLIDSDLNRFNSELWQAMDLLKNQYGFKVQEVMTSGVGSVGNPTTVYILMTK